MRVIGAHFRALTCVCVQTSIDEQRAGRRFEYPTSADQQQEQAVIRCHFSNVADVACIGGSIARKHSIYLWCVHPETFHTPNRPLSSRWMARSREQDDIVRPPPAARRLDVSHV